MASHASAVVTERAKKAGEKEDRRREWSKDDKYGACLILERGEALIPEGLQQGMSQQQFFFFFQLPLLVGVVAPQHKLHRFQPLWDFCGTNRSQEPRSAR